MAPMFELGVCFSLWSESKLIFAVLLQACRGAWPGGWFPTSALVFRSQHLCSCMLTPRRLQGGGDGPTLCAGRGFDVL